MVPKQVQWTDSNSQPVEFNFVSLLLDQNKSRKSFEEFISVYKFVFFCRWGKAIAKSINITRNTTKLLLSPQI